MINAETGQSAVLSNIPEELNGKTGQIWQTVHALRQPGEVAEIRAFSGKGVSSGYFDDYRRLASCATQLDDKGYQV